MKLESISFRPIAHVRFDADEIRLLMKCSGAHYDSVCKSAGKAGGFLYGINNFPNDQNALTFREIDTLAKTAEIGIYITGPDAALALSTNIALRKILLELNEATPSEKVMS